MKNNNRIKHGDEAPSNIPWHIGLLNAGQGNRYICGGTILDRHTYSTKFHSFPSFEHQKAVN